MFDRFRFLTRSRLIFALAVGSSLAIILSLGLSQGGASPSLASGTAGSSGNSGNSGSTSATSTTITPQSDSGGYTTTQVTQTVTYPSPYSPGYTTISQLVKDSTFIVMGTLGEPVTEPAQDGGTVEIYPINVERDFGTYPPRMAIGISSAEFNAGGLNADGTYIFFWASDPVDNTFCVVGGARGMFSYDSSTDTVARGSDDSASQIAQTQTLEQFTSSVVAAETQLQSQPPTNPPPVCSASATGIVQ